MGSAIVFLFLILFVPLFPLPMANALLSGWQIAIVVLFVAACSASFDELGFFRIGEHTTKTRIEAGQHLQIILDIVPDVYRRTEGVFGNVIVTHGDNGTAIT